MPHSKVPPNVLKLLTNSLGAKEKITCWRCRNHISWIQKNRKSKRLGVLLSFWFRDLGSQNPIPFSHEIDYAILFSIYWYTNQYTDISACVSKRVNRKPFFTVCLIVYWLQGMWTLILDLISFPKRWQLREQNLLVPQVTFSGAIQFNSTLILKKTIIF